MRQSIYRVLAALALYPNKSTLAAASKVLRSLQKNRDWTAQMAFYPIWDRTIACVESMTPVQIPGLVDSYNRLFTSSTVAKPIPLTESGYLDQVALISGEVMVDLERSYASAGVAVSSAGGESSDHISVELEFLSFLCGLESEAMDSGDVPGVLEIVRHQTRFLEHHPCRWFPLLACAVSARDDMNVYSQVLNAAWAMVAHDVDFLRTQADHVNDRINES